MDGYDPRQSFADSVSAERHDHRGDERECVAFLRDKAGSGPVLELAIGTGRVALPLAASGLRVDGIDFSQAMLDRLRAKPGGARLDVQLADFADVGVQDQYALIFIVWNSLFNLLEQDDQIRCFQNVARALRPDGVFVIEAFVPSFLFRLHDGQQLRVDSVGTDHVHLSALTHDPATQILEQVHVTLAPGGTRATPVVQRYAWPSELDLMARLSGLRLLERFSDWDRSAYDADANRHVSVYGR